MLGWLSQELILILDFTVLHIGLLTIGIVYQTMYVLNQLMCSNQDYNPFGITKILSTILSFITNNRVVTHAGIGTYCLLL